MPNQPVTLTNPAQHIRRKEKLLQIALEQTTPTEEYLRDLALTDFIQTSKDQVEFWRAIAWGSLAVNLVMIVGITISKHLGV